MLDFLIRWVIHTISLIVVVAVIPGIYVDRWEITIVVSLILGFLNTFLKPLIIFLTLPLYILSLGFMTLIVNGFMFYLASEMIQGFYVENFFNAFLGALLFSVMSFLLNVFFNVGGKFRTRVYHKRFSTDNSDIIDVEGKSRDDDYPKRRIP